MELQKIRLLSLFLGIGAFEKALTNLNIKYELVNYCEIDKHASKAYCLIHDESESKNLWDITKIEIDKLQDFDLVTYGFPCQDISMAGNQRGFSENSNTRSSLLWNVLEIIRYKKPKYCIAENVSALLQEKFKKNFYKLIQYFHELDYNTYWKLLNAKDYNVPQNRERIFIVSIRKDIDNFNFDFPKKEKLNKKLQNILLNKNELIEDNNFIDKKRYYYYSPTLVTNCQQLKIRKYTKNEIEKIKKQKRYGNHFGKITDKIHPTLCAIGKSDVLLLEDQQRKITSLECFRLMGFNDKDFFKLNIISDSQKYKLAGNSIVIDVLEVILRQLFLSNNTKRWLF